MAEYKTCCTTAGGPATQDAAAKPAYLAYFPLVAMIFVATLTAHVLEHAWGTPFMVAWMGLWLILFGMVKLLDIEGFARLFRAYDVVAQVAPPYAYVFPFIELALGLAFLGHYHAMTTSFILLVVAALSLVGVVSGLRQGRRLSCACMGSAAQMPLSFVAVLENGLMMAMGGGYIVGMF